MSEKVNSQYNELDYHGPLIMILYTLNSTVIKKEQ